ncbi:Uncharacterised protein [uncultured Clostridium sp.]|uniref:hypothetical protein n=1 Tax=uncultured Clostridium sp. TaxID=59620 RepID=UPI000822A626|nr:hypothetical protein [uncultured Clostridium sp.]SCK03418.1 Uncharacterised protein [uncultured Clostridium sp.]
MKNDRRNIILSKSDIQQLRTAYNNKNISDDYLNFEVENIMKCEDISKEKAINKILRLVR